MRRLFLASMLIISAASCSVQKPLEPSGPWLLTNLFDENVSQLKDPLTLNIDSAGRVSGFAGCNQYFSTFSVKESAIKFTNTGSTKMFCQETMATEMKFLTALEQVQSFKLDGNKLLLFTDGKVILEFSK